MRVRSAGHRPTVIICSQSRDSMIMQVAAGADPSTMLSGSRVARERQGSLDQFTRFGRAAGVESERCSPRRIGAGEGQNGLFRYRLRGMFRSMGFESCLRMRCVEQLYPMTVLFLLFDVQTHNCTCCCYLDLFATMVGHG
jgi:hypothetical protein